MLKHILLPSDASELSTKAVTHGVQFANKINARISGLTVTPILHHLGLDKTQIMNPAPPVFLSAATTPTTTQTISIICIAIFYCTEPHATSLCPHPLP